jgi:hypothetical protein
MQKRNEIIMQTLRVLALALLSTSACAVEGLGLNATPKTDASLRSDGVLQRGPMLNDASADVIPQLGADSVAVTGTGGMRGTGGASQIMDAGNTPGTGGTLEIGDTLPSTLVYEAENLDVSGYSIVQNAAAGEGAFLQFSTTVAPSVSAEIVLLVLNIPIGTYNITVYYTTDGKQGVHQLQIGSITQDALCDVYSANTQYQVPCDFKSRKFLYTGNYMFRFKNTDKNPASTGYGICIDKIVLTPI